MSDSTDLKTESESNAIGNKTEAVDAAAAGGACHKRCSCGCTAATLFERLLLLLVRTATFLVFSWLPHRYLFPCLDFFLESPFGRHLQDFVDFGGSVLSFGLGVMILLRKVYKPDANLQKSLWKWSTLAAGLFVYSIYKFPTVDFGIFGMFASGDAPKLKEL